MIADFAGMGRAVMAKKATIAATVNRYRIPPQAEEPSKWLPTPPRIAAVTTMTPSRISSGQVRLKFHRGRKGSEIPQFTTLIPKLANAISVHSFGWPGKKKASTGAFIRNTVRKWCDRRMTGSNSTQNATPTTRTLVPLVGLANMTPSASANRTVPSKNSNALKLIELADIEMTRRLASATH